MLIPPLDPGDVPIVEQPSWRSLLVSYALVAAVPLLLWVVAHPVGGIVAAAGIAGLFVGGRRAYRLVHCFAECGGFSFQLGSIARITVSQLASDEAN